MQGPELVVIAIFLMLVLNILIVLATITIKILRNIERNRVRKLREHLEPSLYDYLVTGEVSPILRQVKNRNKAILSDMIVEFLKSLRGSESQRMTELARELGLTARDFSRLRSRDRWQRAKAAENLGFYGGPEAAGPVSNLLEEEDETVRAVASRSLSRIGTSEAANNLATHLKSRSELTSLRMAENLERIGSLAVEPLVELVGSDREKERRAQVHAARILGNLRVKEASPALKQTIYNHWNMDLRAQATLALGKIGNPEDIPAVVEATGDSAWPVRAQAANTLGMIGEVSAVPVLENLMTDEEWWVRLNASRALSYIGPEGEKALVRTLESSDHFARERAAATLEEQGIVLRLVSELVEDGDAEYAEKVIHSVIRIGATRYLDRLSRTLPSKAGRQKLHEMLAETRAEEVEAKSNDA